MTLPSNKSGLARLWEGFKAFQNRVAVALTIVLLFILYFTIFAVVALSARLMGQDLLHPLTPVPDTHWLRREPVENTLEFFARQF